MSNSHNQAASRTDEPLLLAKRLQVILGQGGLVVERAQIQALTTELGVDLLACAAGLLRMLQASADASILAETNLCHPSHSQPEVIKSASGMISTMRMVRYRLDVGSKHQLNLEILKKVLVEESGVDKNNIGNVNIHSLYTLIELPDAMPPDIFQHLKLVEINQRKLDIKRVKSRNNKRRGSPHGRRDKQPGTNNRQVSPVVANQASSEII
jgi:hypothetical protein